MTYPPPDPSYPYQPQQGYGPQPPRKSKTGLWVGLGVGALALIVLLITGFVAPGFFLGDDEEQPNQAGSSVPAAPSEPSAPLPSRSSPASSSRVPPPANTNVDRTSGAPVINEFLARLNAGDGEGALALGCTETKDLLQNAIRLSLEDKGTYTAEQIPNHPHLVDAKVTGTHGSRQVSGQISATNLDDKGFCLSTFFVL